MLKYVAFWLNPRRSPGFVVLLVSLYSGIAFIRLVQVLSGPKPQSRMMYVLKIQSQFFSSRM